MSDNERQGAPADMHSSRAATEQHPEFLEPLTDWETVLERTKERDKHTVDAWKDELNNLLIFTGLFSAVVTAFTAESYKWLQHDNTDTTVMLLAQISLQLSSFTSGGATINPMMINSTAPAFPLDNITPPSPPTRVAVNVNTLWVLSLTLSLLAALTAIAAQQWLRHLSLPPQLAARTAMRLRQLRYESLRVWQVPCIISLLPVAVQVAVVLFLSGLFVLLHSLDHAAAVFVPFIVLAGFGIALFALAAIMPLFNHHCPYKSPLIPAVLIVVQCATYPLVLLAAIPPLLAVAACESWPLEDVILGLSPKHMDLYIVYVYLPAQHVLDYVRSFGTHVWVDMTRFWTHRELRAVSPQPDKTLECTALLATLMSMHQNVFRRVKKCVTEFEAQTRMNSALLSVIRALGFHQTEEVLEYYPRPSANPSLHSLAEHCISAQQVELLLDVLPSEWPERGDPMRDDEAARILLLAYHATLGGAYQLRQRLVGKLWDIRQKQTLAALVGPIRRSVPTILIFKTFKDIQDLSDDRVSDVCSWAEECLEAASHRRSLRFFWPAESYPPVLEFGVPGLVLSAVATALLALVQRPDRTRIDRLLRGLNLFFSGWRDAVRRQASESWSKRGYERPLSVLPEAINSICTSLGHLSDTNNFASTTDNVSLVRRLAGLLRDLCAVRDREPYTAAMQIMDNLERVHCGMIATAGPASGTDTRTESAVQGAQTTESHPVHPATSGSDPGAPAR